jgi:hypothetical protein
VDAEAELVPLLALDVEELLEDVLAEDRKSVV